MLFTDPFFLVVFMPIVLLAFYGSARSFGRHGALTVLFVASCIFYANWGLWFFALMIAGTIINFLICSSLIATPDRRNRFALLCLGQLYNFGTLLYFKYFHFLVFYGGGGRPSLHSAAIPIGISFYTFQQAVLLVDAYARNRHAVSYLGSDNTASSKLKAFIRYGAFHCFFPQLVVGPITYMSEFGPQVEGTRFGQARRIDFEVGCTQIAIGLFKKLALADSLAIIADPTFDAISRGALLTPGQAWAGALAYFVQLYFDFSGYSDMALGIARLFGIRLPVNFYSPLRASSISDFYRRWHITLTRVIGRFLFTPLSVWGTRTAIRDGFSTVPRKLLSVWLPLLLNFEVIALWHGALATYLVFGLIHGTWFIAESEIKTTKAWRSYKARTSVARRRMRGQVLTFLPLMLTFTLFRSDTLDAFGRMVWCMFVGGAQVVPDLKLGANSWLLIAAAFAVVWLMPNSIEILRRYRPGIMTWDEPSTTPAPTQYLWRPNILWACVIAAFAATSLFYINREVPFIYMGF